MLITVAIIVVVMALRWRRMGRARPLKLNQLWIVPTLYSVLVIGFIVASPPPALGWAVLVAGFVIGALVGWQRGKFMRIEVDPATNSLLQRSSPAALLLILGLIVVRMGARSMLPAGTDPMHGTALLVTDGLLGMALGLLSATRVEMYVRGKRLLDAAHGAVA